MEQTKKNGNLLVGAIILVAIIAFVAVIGFTLSRPKPIVIQGEAEAAEYRISGKVPGRIEAFYVKEGQEVHKGDTLVEIDSPEVRAKLAQARAARAAAGAQSTKARNGARQEDIAAAYQLYQKSLVGVDIAKKTLDRATNLHDQGIVSSQKYDEAKAQYEAAVTDSEAAKSRYDMAIKGAREEDKDAAMALVMQAEGAIMEVESYLSELKLCSPADGIVSVCYPKVGELVGQGAPIMSITDLDDAWFTFNIREDYMSGFSNGSEFTVRIPALNDRQVKVKVNYIAVCESYATWRAARESDGYDAKTFEVRAVPASKVEGLRPGMTAIIVR